MKKIVFLTAMLLQIVGASAASTDTLTVRINDMFCRNCANRIMNGLKQVEGVSTFDVQLNKHCLAIGFDADRIGKDSIRTAITKLGYTPVFYCCDKMGYAYFNIPAEQATPETIKSVKAIDGVKDVNASARRKSLAVSFNSTKKTTEQLLAAIQTLGINAVVPKPHECKEEKEK